jgi:hypothetical protein
MGPGGVARDARGAAAGVQQALQALRDGAHAGVLLHGMGRSHVCFEPRGR